MSVLGKTEVLMLQSIGGVGPATLLKVGNYLENKRIHPNSPSEFIDVFKALNIKKKLSDKDLLEELCVAYEKAKKIYRNVVNIKIPFFKEISCNFELYSSTVSLYFSVAAEGTRNIFIKRTSCPPVSECPRPNAKL